jgi:hypothetical protein
MKIHQHVVYISSVGEALTISVLPLGVINICFPLQFTHICVCVCLSNSDVMTPQEKAQCVKWFVEKKSVSTSTDNSYQPITRCHQRGHWIVFGTMCLGDRIETPGVISVGCKCRKRAWCLCSQPMYGDTSCAWLPNCLSRNNSRRGS